MNRCCHPTPAACNETRRSLVIAFLIATGTIRPLFAQSEYGPCRFLNEINSPTSGDFSPTLSPDGLELFFLGYIRPGGFGDQDIWVARRADRSLPFQSPTNLGAVVNSRLSESNPEISSDGLTLYFDSNRPGGFGDRDLWKTTRATLNAPWEPPINLGPGVNTRRWEGRPTITADELTIVFDRSHERNQNTLQMATRPTLEDSFSGRHDLDIASADADFSPDGLTLMFPGLFEGQVDLFQATRPSAMDAFGTPQRVGGSVNSPDYTEVDPGFSFDGRELYFVRTSLDLADHPFLSQADLCLSLLVPEPSCPSLALGAMLFVALMLRRAAGAPQRRRGYVVSGTRMAVACAPRGT